MLWLDRNVVLDKNMLPLLTLVDKEYISRYGENSYRQNKLTIECVLANLVYKVKHEDDLYFSRDKSVYGKEIVNGKEVSTGIGYVSLIKVIELLEDMGWIINHKGFKDIETGNSRCGCIEVTSYGLSVINSKVDLGVVPNKPRASILVLKKKVCNTTKESIEVPFNMSKEKREMKTTLENYNEFMSKQVVVNAEGQTLNTSLARIFNRGDNTFSCGGRFYAKGNSYQTIPEAKRSKILINGKTVCELDFKTIHIAIWCEINGIVLPEGYDIYSHYNPEHFELNKEEINYFVNNFKVDYNPCRNVQKLVWLIMINCGNLKYSSKKNREIAIGAIYKGFLEDRDTPIPFRKFYGVDYINVSEIITDIENNFEYLKPMLYSDVGIKLMKKDSDIMEQILIRCVDAGVPVLCVHDSIIVPRDIVGFCIGVMKESYRKVIGSSDNCVITFK